ncbi:beta-1,3-galactosyltransferase 9 [Bufo bufo]|uniref:beta-1,3-galactosyltransferase 9 n=1 Tax=Bufo bufo TaxID=8384 RepID=UPI001ABEBE63|nr:beta-1,3-galactosyltransferase 9 [Bufo bufo]
MHNVSMTADTRTEKQGDDIKGSVSHYRGSGPDAADGSGSQEVTLPCEPKTEDVRKQLREELSYRWHHAASPCLTLQVSLCRLRTHQLCFILFNVALFHALMFGADFLEEYFLRSAPSAYTDDKFADLRERAQALNLSLQRENISRSYVISGSERCADRNLFLLLVVFSSPENRIRRERIRQTWANTTTLPGLRVTRVFMLGRPQVEAAQDNLLHEAQLHQDLVQGCFPDPSEALKAAMMLEWIVSCPSARFILKADDQVFVNVESLSRHLLTLEARTAEIYTGRVVHQARPDRDPHSQSFVPMTSYSDTFYPDYCSASAMVVSQQAARKMYLVSDRVSLAVPAEVFIGLCAHQAGVLPVHSSRFSGAKHVRYNRCCYRVIFSSAAVGGGDDMSKVWTDLSQGEGCSKLQTYYGLVSCKVWSYLNRIKYYNSGNDGGWGF